MTHNEAILLHGSNADLIKKTSAEIKETLEIGSQNHPDLKELGVGSKSIGITEVKEAISFLVKKPVSAKKKLLIITNAEKLTIDAQNTLLKTLEEPNSTSTILLICEKEEKLLSTIISRCKRLNFESSLSFTEDQLKFAKGFVEGGVGERFFIIEQNKSLISDKTEANTLLNAIAYYIKNKELVKQKTLIQELIKVQGDLSQTNVNPRLAFETLAFA